MANTISGNAGVAGAAIALTGAATASTTSASDGTYSFPGLVAGAYVVTPTLASVTFTPTFLNETIVATDITTANFVAQATTFVSTPTITDDFHRGPAANLGANWTVTNDNFPIAITATNLAVGDPTQVPPNGQDLYTGRQFANDQFASCTIDLFAISSITAVQIRSDITVIPGYSTNLVGDGLGGYTVTLFDSPVGQLGVVATLAGAPQPGDILSIQAVGTLITTFYNGVPIASGTSSTTAAGTPILAIVATAIQTDTSVSLFTAGPILPGPLCVDFYLGFNLLQEDGTSFFQLEDGSGFLILE